MDSSIFFIKRVRCRVNTFRRDYSSNRTCGGDESAFLGVSIPILEPRRLVPFADICLADPIARWVPVVPIGMAGRSGVTRGTLDLQARFLRIGEYKNWYVNNNIEPGFAGG